MAELGQILGVGDEVVGHQQAAYGKQGHDQLQEMEVVLLLGIQEDEIDGLAAVVQVIEGVRLNDGGRIIDAGLPEVGGRPLAESVGKDQPILAVGQPRGEPLLDLSDQWAGRPAPARCRDCAPGRGGCQRWADRQQ